MVLQVYKSVVEHNIVKDMNVSELQTVNVVQRTTYPLHKTTSSRAKAAIGPAVSPSTGGWGSESGLRSLGAPGARAGSKCINYNLVSTCAVIQSLNSERELIVIAVKGDREFDNSIRQSMKHSLETRGSGATVDPGGNRGRPDHSPLC